MHNIKSFALAVFVGSVAVGATDTQVFAVPTTYHVAGGGLSGSFVIEPEGNLLHVDLPVTDFSFSLDLGNGQSHLFDRSDAVINSTWKQFPGDARVGLDIFVFDFVHGANFVVNSSNFTDIGSSISFGANVPGFDQFLGTTLVTSITSSGIVVGSPSAFPSIILTGTTATILPAQTHDNTQTFTIEGTLTNDGNFNNSGALVDVKSGGVINRTGTFTQSSGSFIVNGTVDQTVFINGGTLSGAGTINGSVFLGDESEFVPGNSPGTLTIDGDLTVDAGAVIQIEFGDLIDISGNLEFASGAIIELREYPKLCVWHSVHAVGTGHLLNR
jgi:hypothetical protein